MTEKMGALPIDTVGCIRATHWNIYIAYTIIVANTLLSHVINYILFRLSLATAKFIGHINFVHIIAR